MPWRSDRPGDWPRRWWSARISASIRFICCFPSRLRIALDFAGLILLVGFFALIAWHGSGVVMQSWTSGSRSQSDLQTPTVIPQLAWIAGLCLFIVVGLALLLMALARLRAGDLAGVARLIGTRSAEEEVEEEIQALAALKPGAEGG